MSVEDDRRRGLEAAVAVVVLVGGGWPDAVGGALVAAAIAVATWRLSGRWLAGAIALALLFPVAARLARRVRVARLRRRFAREPEAAARAERAAWERATPGQRAALTRITKPPA
jgi:hypothetical protein